MEENNNSTPYSNQGEMNLTPESRLRVTAKMKGSLLSSMKWIQFFLILGCFAVGMLLIVALGMLIGSSLFPFGSAGMPPLVLVGMGLLYLLISALYIYPIMKGFKLIDHTRKALRAGTNADFEASADDFHAIMKFCGILTIAGFLIYIIGIISVFAFTAFNI